MPSASHDALRRLALLLPMVAAAACAGGGAPSEGVFGLVREFETAPELGRPGTRALRVADLCRQAP